MSRIGDKIKETRNEMGMSQKQLAKKLGIAESFLNEVEMGRKVISEDLISRVSKVLGKNMNDISMSFEEEVYEEEKTKRIEPKRETKKVINSEPVNELWGDAFGSIIKSVPVYKYNLKDAVEIRKLPITGNKVEGYAQDKVLFIQIEDDDMSGFRIAKGDIAFAHITHEIENNAICLIDTGKERVIRQINRLDGNKILLVSNRGSVRTETVNAKDIKILARIDKVEIKL